MSGETTKMNLSTLPLELMAQIFGHLKPVDILSIRATSKVLAEATFERLVWHHAFTQILDQQGAVYPFKELDSMTREELESATLRSTRFIKTVLASEGKLTPTKSVKLDYAVRPYDDVPDMWDTGFSDAFLLGGGRFLVTVYMRRLINLWNLEDVCRQSQRCNPIASLELATELSLGNPVDWHVSVNQSHILDDRTTVRLVNYITDANNHDNFRICIHEIQPYSSSPVFRLFRIWSRPEFAEEDLDAFDGDRIVFSDQNGWVTIWDLCSDSSISWQLETKRSPAAVAMTDSKVLLFYDVIYVKVYDVSKLPFGESKQSKTLPFVPSYSRKGIDLNSDNVPSNMDFLVDQRYFISQPQIDMEPLSMVAYSDEEEDSTGLHVLIVEPSADANCLNEPMIYRQASVASVTGHISLAWGQFSGESYALMWEEEIEGSATILLCVLAPCGCWPTGTQTPMKKNTVRIAELVDESSVDLFDFCPVTTRLVTIANGDVRIMEFDPKV